MAISPLFVSDADTLKAALRLSSVEDEDAAQPIFERGMQYARSAIYRRLGTTVANQWAAVAYVENPTTEQGILRTAATLLEVELVFVYLLENLPNFFMDDSGGIRQAWNEEGAFRSFDSEARAELKKNKLNQIEEYFDLLSETDELGNDEQIKVYTGENETDPKPTPGASALYLPDDGSRFDGNFRRTGLYPQD